MKVSRLQLIKSVTDLWNDSGESIWITEFGNPFHNLTVAGKKLNLWVSILKHGIFGNVYHVLYSSNVKERYLTQ